MAMLQTVPMEDRRCGIPGWWITVFLFWLGWVFMYADRTILNPIMKDIQLEYGLSATQLGLLNSVFFLSYAFLQVPAGVLGDKIGKKKVLVPGFIFFGVFTAVSGMMKSFTALLFARVMTGAGQATYYGPQYGLSSEQIPPERRTFGSAIINCGMAFGLALGMMVSSYLVYDQGYNWRVPFFVMSVPTVVIALLIWFLVKEKKSGPVAQQAADTKKGSFMDLLKNRNLMVTYLMVFCSLFGFFLMVTWLPYYLQNERGIDGSQIGNIASLIAWVSIPGGLLFASISDKLGRRKPLIMFMVPVAIISLISIVQMQDVNMMIVALCVYGLFGKLAMDPVLVATIADNAPKESYSSAFGMFNFVGMSSSILAPTIAGAITDVTGSLAAGFYLSAGLLVLGLVGIMFLKEHKPAKTATA